MPIILTTADLSTAGCSVEMELGFSPLFSASRAYMHLELIYSVWMCAQVARATLNRSFLPPNDEWQQVFF